MFTGKLKITDRTNLPLPDDARTVLASMFSGYREVIAKSEFQSGFSGSRVLLVRPIRDDGAELPAVVKIDRAARIRREWLAYKTHIQNRLPDVAELRGQPVYPSGSAWGGLWYPLVGAGTFDIESLRQYCQHANVKDICHVLEARLFRSLNALWRQTRQVCPDLHLQTEYDSFLPVNLTIDLAETPGRGQPHRLRPDNINERACAINDYVQVSGFRVVNIDYHTRRLSLDMPLNTGAAYRIHVYPVAEIEKYEMDEVVPRPFTGVVQKTRQSMLREQATAAMGADVDVTAATFTLPDGSTLPNPLTKLPAILNQMFDAHTSYIHGDLHLQNVLVEPENRNAYLIDFSHARRGHALRDLLHLESAVITQLLPEAIKQTGQTPPVIHALYKRLHCALQAPSAVKPPPGLEKPFAILESIRKAARPHLFQENDWREYYYGLIIYLLGSLKFKSLDRETTRPYPKQLAFLGAAVTLKLLEMPPPCVEEPESNAVKEAESVVNAAVRADGIRYQDIFSPYETGMQRLLAQMEQDHPRYLEALGYQSRLQANINRSRRFKDTDSSRAERAEIIERLNELALSVIGVSFNALCQGTRE